MHPSRPGIRVPELRFNEAGLIPAIVQDLSSGEVLMLAWMNEDSLQESLDSGRTVFWSRSRNQRWRKGDTSGDRQWIREVFYDCDADTLLFKVQQEGRGACHTGARSCFFRSLSDNLEESQGTPGEPDGSAPPGSDL